MRTWHLQAGLFVAAVAMRMMPDPVASLSYVVVALFALAGRAQAIQALLLTWLLTMLSPGIAAEAAGASIGRYAVLSAAAMSVLGRHLANGPVAVVWWPVVATMFLSAFLIVHSLLVSPVVDVSLLKAASWSIATITLLVAWRDLDLQENVTLIRQVTIVLVFVLVISAPLLVSPLGYLRNGRGFQGVLNHPQAFGSTMALLGAWATARLFVTPNPSSAAALLAVGCLCMIVLSESRTAGVAMILGVAVAIVVAILSGRPIRESLPGVGSRRVQVTIALVAASVLLSGPFVSGLLSAFVSKRGESEGIASAYEASRGFLILRMWANVQDNPLRGIGFGIASNPEKMVVERDAVLGLPAGAPVEKGVLPVAVLEELGVFGFAVVALWFWMIFRRAGRSGVAPLAMCMTILFLNFAESMFFSPGGMGLLLLILLCWAPNAQDSGEFQA